MSRLTIIVAATKANGIGQNGQLPWKLSKELKYFARVTSDAPEGKQNAVIMGRNTWESIPTKFQPLPKRLNVVLSRNTEYDLYVDSLFPFVENIVCSRISPRSVPSDAPAVVVKDFRSASEYIDKANIYRGFVIGGASLYAETLGFSSSATALVDRVLLTRILSPDFDDCDTFMPDFLKAGDEKEWRRASHKALQDWVGFEVPEGAQEEKGISYEFQMWTREV